MSNTNIPVTIQALEVETREILYKLYAANITDDEVTKFEDIEIELDHFKQTMAIMKNRLEMVTQCIEEHHRGYWDSDE